MKNKLTPLIIIIMLLLFIPNNIKISNGNSVDLLKSEGIVAIQVANTNFTQQVEVAPIQICNCQGTKIQKSGDGIIDMPCVCMPNCKCKKTTEQGKLGEVKASKYYTYEFGATWCTPCIKWRKEDIPKLKNAGWKFNNGTWESDINVVTVDVDDYKALFSKYAITERESPVGIPYYVVVNNGTKIASHQGYMNWIEFANWHNDIINKDKTK